MNPHVRKFESDTEWLAARRWDEEQGTVITASDSRGVLGVGYANENPLSVYADKVSSDDPDPETRNMRLRVGLLLEGPCAELFEMLTGIKLRGDRMRTLRYNRKRKWLAATLDRYYTRRGEIVPVEFKVVSRFEAQQWKEEPSLKAQVQIQHQLAVCDADFGWVLAFQGVDQDPFVKKVYRDDNFINVLIPKLEEFKGHCDNRVPPPADFSEACSQALFRLHPDDDGFAVTMPDSLETVNERLAWLMDLEKAVTTQRKWCQNIIKAALGDHTYAVFRDKIWSWKTHQKKPEEQPRKGYKYRSFLEAKELPKQTELIEYEKQDYDQEELNNAQYRLCDFLKSEPGRDAANPIAGETIASTGSDGAEPGEDDGGASQEPEGSADAGS